MKTVIKNSISDFIVGTVREIKGTSVIIRMFENTSQLVHFFEGIRYSGVIIGSYIGIIRGQYTIVGKIEKEYAYDLLKDAKLLEFKKDRFVREIEVKIIGSFKNNSFITGMVAFPQIFNDVVLLSNDQKEKIIEGKEEESEYDIPKFIIGQVWPDSLPYNLNWSRLFNSHIAIFGNTGSGKSNTLAKIYHELFKLNFEDKLIELGDSKFVILDFNGEYTADESIIKEKKVYNLSTKSNTESADLENRFISIPNSKFWEKEMLSVLFGATEQTQQPFLSRVLSYYFQSERNFEESLPFYIAQAFENVYMVSNKNSLDLLKQIVSILGLENKDISSWVDYTLYNSSYETFYSEHDIDGWNNSKGSLYYWNVNDEKLKIEKEAIISKLNDRKLSIENPMMCLQIAAYLKMIYELRLNFVQYDHIAPLLHRIEARVNDFSKVIRIVDYEDDDIFRDTVNVVSLKNVNQDMKMLIPMIIAKVTYEMNKNSNNTKNKIFNLIIDEAHNILSDVSNRESEKWKDYRLEVFEEIIKEGRKFGYFLTISSQRPADISPTIVSQIHNYFIHRLVNDNDLRLLDRTMTTLDSVSKESIPNLAPGQVILTGVLFDLPVIVKIDELEKKIAPNSENIPLLDIWKVNKNSQQTIEK